MITINENEIVETVFEKEDYFPIKVCVITILIILSMFSMKKMNTTCWSLHLTGQLMNSADFNW